MAAKCLSLKASWQRAAQHLNDLNDRLRSMVPADPSYQLVVSQIETQKEVVAQAADAYQECEDSSGNDSE